MRVVGIWLILLGLSACSTELTQAGKSVRQVSLQTANSCQFLGPVTGSESMGLDEAMDVTSAFNKVRNSVGELGGNAFVVSASSTSSATTVVQADAYSC
ncbi:DUF4156 domain-containing protein [Roseovarius sp. MMSF_3350]|uniref:DUF4156 domain-containing protein n=1 Tax=Roseovarius sp. MMSF_3350 TaxID=3046706 RepID=UPI003532525F